MLLLLFLLCAFVLGAGVRTSYSSSSPSLFFSSLSLSGILISIYCRAQLLFVLSSQSRQQRPSTKTWTSWRNSEEIFFFFLSSFLLIKKRTTTTILTWKKKFVSSSFLFFVLFFLNKKINQIEKILWRQRGWPRTGAKIATVRYDNSDIAAASAYGKMTMVSPRTDR